MNFRRPLIQRLGLFFVISILGAAVASRDLYAQLQSAGPAKVPDAVAIARPSAEEIEIARSGLDKLLESADSETKAVLDKYPGLVEVRPPRENSAVIPNLAGFFRQKHEANKAVAKQGEAEILFMGDSITDFWRNENGPFAGKTVFDEHFGDWKVANFGIAGDTTQGVLYRLQNGEGEGFQPKAVMLMIGTNNTGRNSAAEIAEGIGAVVLELQNRFPKAKILLLAVFPRGRANDPVRGVIAEINATIQKLHDGERVHYLDIGKRFLDDDGNIPQDVMSDGLHPSAKGYEIWAQAVKEPLSKLRAEQPAPKASPQGVRAAEIPHVYNVENTGAKFAKPRLPDIQDLPMIRALPDPFAWSDGSGRSTEFSDWIRRRAEIKAEIEHYGIGIKPDRPEEITASFKDGTLTVNVTVRGETLTLTSQISQPAGDGPFPAVIGIGRRGSGSLPTDIFESRGVAMIPFNFQQVMAHTQTRGKEPINRLYPDLTYIGAYSAWSWGVSRLIDGLELVQDDLPIDLNHLAITGCSFAGKMALFAGAFDERIALTIAQESGGGGAAAWRVSETLGNVETLGNTSNKWFIEDMFRFSNKVPKLPYDHHELMAMVAPRALLVLGNPDYQWLADESGYVSCRAAHEVWKQFGIGDRFGFSIVAGHQHCQLPDSQDPEVAAFVDKFLLGKIDADTDVAKHPFENVNYIQWYDGWLTGKSTFPELDRTNIETVFAEAESGEIGSDWNLVDDAQASGGKCLIIKSGLNSTGAAPTGSSGVLQIPLKVANNAKYYVFARVNCPTADDDSFWVRVNDGELQAANGLRTTGWDWVQLTTANLSAGEHNLTVAYREDGAAIDQICFTTHAFGPSDLSE